MMVALVSLRLLVPSPIAFWDDSRLSHDANVLDLSSAACPLELSANGLVALGETAAVLYGQIDAAAGAYRSLLLRSADDGRSWQEVMEPRTGSAVIAVSFPSGPRGFALVGWVVEDPGELFLYATDDSGRTWRVVLELHKPHAHRDRPLGLVCSSASRCRVPLECEDGPPGHSLNTIDGGRSWQTKSGVHTGDAAVRSAASGGTRWKLVSDETSYSIHVAERPVTRIPRGLRLVARRLGSCEQPADPGHPKAGPR